MRYDLFDPERTKAQIEKLIEQLQDTTLTPALRASLRRSLAQKVRRSREFLKGEIGNYQKPRKNFANKASLVKRIVILEDRLKLLGGSCE